MNILTISGSAQKVSSNEKFLKALPSILKGHAFIHFEGLPDLPLFSPERNNKAPEMVLSFRESISNADLVIISTPEYTHNIPAVLKNALEWITYSGELYDKKVLAITYAPSSPRGEKAMQSLIWSLQALNAKIVAELPLYQNELKVSENGELLGEASIQAIKAVFDFI